MTVEHGAESPELHSRFSLVTYWHVHVDPSLSVHPTPTSLSPLGVHIFVLYLCVSISVLQIKSSIPFFRLPWRLSGKESTYQCRRHRFNPWVGKILWRRAWQPTPVFMPGKSHGQRSLSWQRRLQAMGSRRLKWLSAHMQAHTPHFSRFRIYTLIYNIWFSLSDLLHSVW